MGGEIKDVDLSSKDEDISFMLLNKTDEGQRKVHVGPPLKINLWERLFYRKAGKLVSQGANHVLDHGELWSLPEDLRSPYLWDKFQANWSAESMNNKPSLVRAIRNTFYWEWVRALGFQTLFGLASFVNPIVLPYMITYLSDPDVPDYLGFVYIAIIVFVTFIGSLLYYNSIFESSMLGIKIRSVLMQLVYRKVLVLAPSKQMNSGMIVNLLANDTQFFSDTLSAFNNGLVAPIQIVVATVLVWLQVGPYALIIWAVLGIFFPVSMWLGRRFGTFRAKIQAAADKRLKLTNEIINGIRIVKFYAWELPFLRNISEARERELKEVKGLALNRAFLVFLMSNSTTVIIGLIFLFYGLYGSDPLTTSRAYATLSLINLLKLPFFLLPFATALIKQYSVTFDRVQQFITKPDIKYEAPIETEDGKAELIIEDGEFKWDSQSDKSSLSNVNLKMTNGDLVMVVGAVGSGKSTLSMAALGEVSQVAGKRSLKGRISYVPQEPFIINATLRENILFGEPYEEEKYNKILNASALITDIKLLPYGDKTEIGERGINLSGGQKQRVSIARALYSNKDLYILDDPFSAVDTHVGKHLFEEAVKGYLKDKSVLLITNQLQYLPYASNIMIIDNGKVTESGKFRDLKENSSHLKKLLSNFGEISEEESNVKQQEKPTETKEQKENKVTAPSGKQRSETMIKMESKQSGLVGIGVYYYYVKAGSLLLFMLVMSTYIGTAAANIGSSWWLSVWTSESETSGRSLSYYIGIYLAWLGGQAFASFFSLFILTWFAVAASRYLHNTLLYKVVRAPIAFFDVTPVGRIINRFAKELSLIDALLPMQLNQYLNAIFTLLGIFAAMLFASPFIVIGIVPMIGFYIWFQQYYRHTSIELQRLESVSRAPILSNLAETISGTTSIRAYRLEETFRNMNKTRVDFNATELFALKYCSTYFGQRLDFAGIILVMLTLLAIVLTRILDFDSVNVGYAALAISYCSGLSFILSNLNVMAVETETRMNSVERIKEYETLDQEAPDEISDNRPPSDWPSEGKVTFKGYSLKYRDGPMVLKNINASVAPQDKIGIVGRTGAGKSSLMQALFRMVEPAEGTIEIDGIDITSIGLRDLRSKLSIIPQEPTLFIGTVRYNLDPFSDRTDAEIWRALEMVHLKDAVSALPGKLDEPIAEHGSNFSVGQRQLICMARALLRNTKILLMDEATASVDLNTDILIQRMVRKNFKDRTVLTIAHRLNTIMDSTRVMVLDKGHLSEYNSPAKLLTIPDGIFSSMVDAGGPAVAAYLKKIANGEISAIDALEQSQRENSPRSPVESNENSKKKKKKKSNKTDENQPKKEKKTKKNKKE